MTKHLDQIFFKVKRMRPKAACSPSVGSHVMEWLLNIQLLQTRYKNGGE